MLEKLEKLSEVGKDFLKMCFVQEADVEVDRSDALLKHPFVLVSTNAVSHRCLKGVVENLNVNVVR